MVQVECINVDFLTESFERIVPNIISPTIFIRKYKYQFIVVQLLLLLLVSGFWGRFIFDSMQKPRRKTSSENLLVLRFTCRKRLVFRSSMKPGKNQHQEHTVCVWGREGARTSNMNTYSLCSKSICWILTVRFSLSCFVL